ncbi:MAG: SLBB domain-containing protein, partial [Azospirillaceae bacterium]
MPPTVPTTRRKRPTALALTRLATIATALAAAVLAAIAPCPDAAAAEDRAPTPLEQRYSERAGMPLRLVGHRLFAGASATPGADAPSAAAAPVGRVEDSYRLGPGDRLTVTYHGRENGGGTVTVANDGMVVMPEGPPIPAAGRPLGDVRSEIRSIAAAKWLETEVHVALATGRQRVVTVVGEVRRPGRHRVGPFATVLDALFAAGGPTGRGSLRAIALVRDGGATTLDLADLGATLPGADADRPVADGDRLVVPPLGPTVAIAGAVGRPGIHELPPGAQEAPAGRLIDLAGGLLPGAGPVLRFGWDSAGGAVAEVLDAPFEATLAPGDLVMVRAPADAARPAAVTLSGAVAAPGDYPLAAGADAAALIEAAGGAGETAYPLAGAIR